MTKETGEFVSILKKIDKPRLYLNPIACWILRMQGKRDGKKRIPFEDKNTNSWISPIIKREHAKVDEYMANVSYDVDKKCGHIYSETESMISECVLKYCEILGLYNYLLKNSISYDDLFSEKGDLEQTKKDLINMKRKNEEKLDSAGIKIRRYNEYIQREISGAKRDYLIKKDELMNLYRKVVKNYQSICFLESELEIYFCGFCAKITRRTSCYWHGVLLTHPEKNRLPQYLPDPTKNTIFDIHISKRSSMKEKMDLIEYINIDLFSKDYIK